MSERSAPVEERIDHERDYLERTIATVRNHRDAENCWPSWANIFADEIERLWKVEDALLTEHSAVYREALKDCAIAANNGIVQHESRKRGAVEKLRYIFKRSSAALLPATESAQPEEERRDD